MDNNSQENSSKPKKGTKADAAAWSGIPEDQILDFKVYGNRYVVVTTSGQKVKTSAADRAAAAEVAGK